MSLHSGAAMYRKLPEESHTADAYASIALNKNHIVLLNKDCCCNWILNDRLNKAATSSGVHELPPLLAC